MVNDILAGILLGACITLVVAFLFTFYARRKCWIELKVAPNPTDPNASIDHMALIQLMDKYDEIEARLTDTFNKVEDLDKVLEPYLLAEAMKKKNIMEKKSYDNP